MNTRKCWPLIVAVALGAAPRALPQDIRADLSAYSPDCGVNIRQDGPRLLVNWPMAAGEHGQLALDLRPGRPVIASLGIAADATGDAEALLQEVEPLTFLTVGTRQAPSGRPPEMSIWNT